MISEVQKRIIEMAKVFHNFCEQYGLNYYMLGGTMLGAIRHKGMIPWDDDMDFGMPREDYDKLMELRGNLEDKYTFNFHTTDKNFKYGFCKMYDETTTYLEQMASETQFVGGVYIDIFPLDYIGKDYNKAIKIAKEIAFRRKIVQGVLAKGKRSTFVKDIGVRFLQLLPKSQKWFDYPYKLLKKYNKSNSDYYLNVYGHWNEKEVSPIEWFGEPTLYEFEDTKFYGIKDYDNYLTKMYGDYMTPPPEDKRRGHSIAFIDMNMPYKEYIKIHSKKKENL